MGVYNIINKLKINALTVQGVNSVEYGDIQLYNNKADIEYPYINFDILSSNVIGNGAKTYIIRAYFIDRNEPYEAYSKTEDISDNFMDKLEIQNYITNYFTMEFNDNVSGVFIDIQFESILSIDCIPYTGIGYVILENGDFLNKYLLLTTEGKIIIDN